MEKLDRDTDGSSLNIVQDNIEKLKALFPDIFSEDKIDFDKLRETLGDRLETDEERYNFTWHGKTQARRIAQTPSTGTLRPCKEESKHWDMSKNLFIEGDNLEVLKLLQKSYHKQVKMIYIDPPYNTGKEFIYPDNYQDNLDTYLKYTGQKDSEGRKFGTNAETSGRYHTNWLNMMYPRLKLARNLLRDDGVIFISIDDNEEANLRKLCDEIFGEENFVSLVTVQSNPRGRQSDTHVASVHDYLLIYAKKISCACIAGAPLTAEQKAEFNMTDDEGNAYRLLGLRQRGAASRREDRPDMYFPIYVNPMNQEISIDKVDGWIAVYPRKSDGSDGRWMWGKDKCKRDKNLLVTRLIERRNEYDIFVIDLLVRSGGERTRKVKSIWDSKSYNNQAGTQEVKFLLKCDAMSFPKPVSLLSDICRMGLTGNEMILDFFSGSCTTAHAVMDLNAQDNGNHKFIMVQLPEPCDEKSEAYKAGYKTIADIGKERIRRAGEKILQDNAGKEGIKNLNIGFKVFKLNSSNIKPWDADFDNLESALFDTVDNIKAERSEDDVLYEILLKYGLDLTVPIEERQIKARQFMPSVLALW
ncbi:site-specific DNA-methyltransferase [Candidatus Methylobacter favarea]|nr:site-specific DNA-methyltransferase [Candidatus Methylobacter favarea]